MTVRLRTAYNYTARLGFWREDHGRGFALDHRTKGLGRKVKDRVNPYDPALADPQGDCRLVLSAYKSDDIFANGGILF